MPRYTRNTEVKKGLPPSGCRYPMGTASLIKKWVLAERRASQGPGGVSGSESSGVYPSRLPCRRRTETPTTAQYTHPVGVHEYDSICAPSTDTLCYAVWVVISAGPAALPGPIYRVAYSNSRLVPSRFEQSIEFPTSALITIPIYRPYSTFYFAIIRKQHNATEVIVDRLRLF